jgi:iron complex transport system substrate-binding protein
VVDGTKPNYEAISQSKPNLVVYDSTLYSEADLAKIKEMGIETFDVKATSLAQYADNIRRLASRTGAETTAADYLDKVEVQRKKGLSFAQTPAPRVAIILPSGGGADHMIAGTKGFLADVVKNSGGEPVGPESEKFETIGAEALMALQPDVIITSGDPATVLNDARLKGMAAIQKQNVIGFKDQDILLRAGARVDKLLEVISNALRVKK